MSSNKLVHLKPTLWRAFERAVARHEKLGARIVEIGVDNAGDNLFRQLDHARERMLDLAGRCQSIEIGIDVALNPLETEEMPDFTDAEIEALFA